LITSLIRVKIELPRVFIDSSRSRSEIGFKSSAEVREEGKVVAREAAFKGIGRRLQEGDRMKKIEAGGNPIAEIAAKAFKQVPDFNVGIVPKSSPEISVKEGKVTVEVIA